MKIKKVSRLYSLAPVSPRKRKVISMPLYQKKMDAIIKKGFPVAETLIELLAEASKWKIKGIKMT